MYVTADKNGEATEEFIFFQFLKISGQSYFILFILQV